MHENGRRQQRRQLILTMMHSGERGEARGYAAYVFYLWRIRRYVNVFYFSVCI